MHSNATVAPLVRDMENLTLYVETSPPMSLSFDIADPANGSNTANETTEPDLEYFYFYQVETLTFLWVLFTMIVVGNSSVLVALLLSKNRKSRMNFFIMHLAIADLAVGLISVLTDIIWKTTVDWYGGNVGCKFVRFAQILVTYSSTYVLVALSIDRYDAITHPMNFSGSWKRARWLVATAWITSTVMSVPAIFLNHEVVVKGRLQCWINLTPWEWKLYMTLVAISLFFIPTLIITACYSIIVYTIWTKSKILSYPKLSNKSVSSQGSISTNSKSGDHDTDTKRTSSRGIIPKAKIKTIKMTLIIVFVFVLCWSPYFIYDLLQVYGYISQTQTAIAVSTFIQSLAPLNSVANPVIYCLFSTNLCRNLRSLRLCNWLAEKLCKCCAAPGSSSSRPSWRDHTTSRPSEYTTMSESLHRFSCHNRLPMRHQRCGTVVKRVDDIGVRHQNSHV
ncbi:cardioacceleratory peptide receptor-like isoform X2 [Ornithodoros turicata]|uniref:cardioacceleratory peptide receptor-like isoform X2 n=1 Tax=Ornithodoros turicata TaxID=34597 RepID=UPI003139DD7B